MANKKAFRKELLEQTSKLFCLGCAGGFLLGIFIGIFKYNYGLSFVTFQVACVFGFSFGIGTVAVFLIFAAIMYAEFLFRKK